MGLITTYIAYRIGKRRGRNSVPSAPAPAPTGDPQCLNYESFCKNYGSCHDQICEYEVGTAPYYR